jgi:hypothetical protein
VAPYRGDRSEASWASDPLTSESIQFAHALGPMFRTGSENANMEPAPGPKPVHSAKIV